MTRRKAWILFIFAAMTLCPSTAAADGDAKRGEKLFARCSACHSIDGQKKTGPSLSGVIGRKAGSVAGARYSKALAQSNLVWTDDTLDAYLAAPATLVPGTTMTMRIPKDQDRQDLISYLRSKHLQ
jgi:cytochrome c